MKTGVLIIITLLVFNVYLKGIYNYIDVYLTVKGQRWLGTGNHGAYVRSVFFVSQEYLPQAFGKFIGESHNTRVPRKLKTNSRTQEHK